MATSRPPLLDRWPHRRLTVWSGIGYLLFAAGTLLCVWLAWRDWNPDTDENPLVVLVIAWVAAGVSHMTVRKYWLACGMSASGSVLGYVAVAVESTPNPFLNEMFAAGIIEVGLFGFLLSMLMGIPVLIYRRLRTRAASSGSDPA